MRNGTVTLLPSAGRSQDSVGAGSRGDQPGAVSMVSVPRIPAGRVSTTDPTISSPSKYIFDSSSIDPSTSIGRIPRRPIATISAKGAASARSVGWPRSSATAVKTTERVA
jgi:hypothetical protein